MAIAVVCAVMVSELYVGMAPLLIESDWLWPAHVFGTLTDVIALFTTVMVTVIGMPSLLTTRAPAKVPLTLLAGPSTKPASVVINKDSIPKLTQEAVSAQSAKKVAVVSGASLTSAAFKQSLQSALTKAGIKG